MTTIDNLTVTQHSSTAIQYTITNKALPSSIILKILLFNEHACRLGLGLWSLTTILTTLHTHWSTWHDSTTHDNTQYNTLSSTLSHLTSLSSPLLIPLTALAAVYALSRAQHTTTESLLLMHSLGAQTQQVVTSFPLFTAVSSALQSRLGWDLGIGVLFGTTTTRFLPTTTIQDLLVLEAFVGWEVRFFLGIVVKGEDGVVIVFETCRPRLDVVRRVWREGRSVLWMDGKSKQEQEGG